MVDTDAISSRLDSTVWVGVGAVGVLLFLVGVYRPALSGVPDADVLGILVAVAGACLGVVGFSFALDQRRADQDRPRRRRRPHAELTDEFGPTFQVYDPRTAEESAAPDPPAPPAP
jgi:hypothetical protein